MSSERQIADGLTKESARTLLTSRLRHRRLKLTWDPTYTAAKKKTKAERIKAIKESTIPPPLRVRIIFQPTCSTKTTSAHSGRT